MFPINGSFEKYNKVSLGQNYTIQSTCYQHILGNLTDKLSDLKKVKKIILNCNDYNYFKIHT